MKKILVILMLFFAFGCSDNVTESTQNMIVGTWIKQIPDKVDKDVNLLIIEFTKYGNYRKVTVGHDHIRDTIIGRYSIDYDQIVIVDIDCDQAEGKYGLIFNNNSVEFVTLSDHCKRANYFDGFFSRYEDNLFNLN